MGVRMLRAHAELVGLQSSFTILDTDDQERLAKQIIQAADLDERRWPRAAAGRRSSSAGRTAATGRTRCRPRRSATSRSGSGVALYAAYQQRLATLNACDFGDLLLHGLTLLTQQPDLLAHYQRRFRAILVDEYQDTNVAQYLWLRLLAGGHKNITCVGDDDQSIYSWRGAEVGNILRFEQDFPGAQVIRLERNYRSTGHILGAASGVIAQQPRPPRQDAVDRGRAGRAGPGRRPVGRPGGGPLRRRRGRGLAAAGRQAQPGGGAGARRLPDPLLRGAVHPAGHPLPGDRRPALLRAGRDPRRDRLFPRRLPARRRSGAWSGSSTCRGAASATAPCAACARRRAAAEVSLFQAAREPCARPTSCRRAPATRLAELLATFDRWRGTLPSAAPARAGRDRARRVGLHRDVAGRAHAGRAGPAREPEGAGQGGAGVRHAAGLPRACQPGDGECRARRTPTWSAS